MRYPWSKLNSLRFEELAKQYLEDKHPQIDWILLPQSGDGNRDIQAVTTELMFDRSVESKQWAEAKYTKAGKRALQKGQLDPTIVSVLLDGSVRALMFLTNSRYTDSYILRAQEVLRPRLRDNVHFIEGEQLEAWLDNKPEIVSSFFPGMKPAGQPVAAPPPTLISAKLIGTADYMDGHWEVRESLYQNEELILALVVSSQVDLYMTATVDEQGLGLAPTPTLPDTLRIRIGLQIIPLRVVAREKHLAGKTVVSLREIGGDRHCTATVHYSIGAVALHVDCAGQQRASQSLNEVLRLHHDTPRPGCVSLIGASGSGKSFILRQSQKVREYRPLHLQVFNEPVQNARGLCRSLLFLSFGSAVELDGLISGGKFKSTDFPSELVQRLLDGMNGMADAQETLESVLVEERFADLFTLRSRGDAKVLVFDDVQKADELSRRVLEEMLKQLVWSENRTLVVFARHANYSALDDAIRPLLIRNITVNPLSAGDIKSTIDEYLRPDVVKAVLPDAQLVIKTALELRYLVSELRSNPDLMTLATESAVTRIRAHLVAASIPEIATRIQVAKVEEAADLVVILNAGVPESFLLRHFDATVITELLNSELFVRRRDRAGEPSRIVASHDLLAAAYLKRRNIYSARLANRIENLLKEEPQRRNDILGHLCLCGDDWRQRYLSEALEARDALCAETRFGAALSLAHALYELVHIEELGQLGLAPEEHLSILYGYADCVNHTEGSGRALALFNETISIGKSYSTSPEAMPFILQAQAEQFNMRFWQHDLSGFQTQVKDFLKTYDHLPVEWRTPRILEAKTVALNRLMMVEYLLDAPKKAEEVFSRAWEYSQHHGHAHDRANLLMDSAKSMMLMHPSEALSKMEQACEIYAQTTTQRRRLMVCRAQTAYLRSMLQDQSFLVLEQQALALLKEGYAQEYANCLLQISALHLIAGRYDDALGRLDELGRRHNALEQAPRRAMLYHHLRGVATALRNSPHAALPAFDRHEVMAKAVGKSYREIAAHNAAMDIDASQASWAFEQRTDAYRLDPRLW